MTENHLFYNRLMKAVKQSGKSMNCIERELGYTRNALNNYKNGTEPSGSRLVELAQYFKIYPEYLIGKTDEVYPIYFAREFQHLRDDQKMEILKISQEWGNSKIINSQKERKIY